MITAFRYLVQIALPAGVLVLAGCTTDGTAYVASTEPAPTVDITRLQAWKDAEALAGLDPERFTVLGSGESMRPVYGENTILVLQKLGFEELRPGMNVAYTNSQGKVVVHRLVATDVLGWRVVGLNNQAEDSERVTRYNLRGVVYASFANEGVK